jgi:ABC-type molybdate transport system substrate-binding protein
VARFGDLPVDSFEASARAVVTRLALDEADLGVAYATDVSSHPDLVAAWPQEPTCPCVSYAAVALSPVGTPFVAFLADDRARSILTTHGFPVEPPR